MKICVMGTSCTDPGQSKQKLTLRACQLKGLFSICRFGLLHCKNSWKHLMPVCVNVCDWSFFKLFDVVFGPWNRILFGWVEISNTSKAKEDCLSHSVMAFGSLWFFFHISILGDLGDLPCYAKKTVSSFYFLVVVFFKKLFLGKWNKAA